MKKKYFNLHVLSVVFFSMFFAAAAFGQTNDIQTDLNQSFTRYDLVKIEIRAARGIGGGNENSKTLSFRAAGRDLELNVAPHDLRAARYKAEDASPVGVRQLEKEAITTFKGKIAGEDDSTVRLTIDEAKIEGYFLTGGEMFYVEPAIRYSRLAAADDLVVYREGDLLKTVGVFCDVAEKIEEGRAFVEPNITGAVAALRVIELATEADFQYVSTLGGASQANAEILNILNFVEGIYERDLNLTISVVYQHTWTTQDPFTGADVVSLLTSFQSYWNANFPTTQVPRDAAHLFTAKPFALGSGYAYVGVICRNPGASYGLSGYIDWEPAKYLIPAHELGHNLGANHNDSTDCQNTVMNTQLSGATVARFCPASVAEIVGYVNNNSSCLSNLVRTRFDFDGDGRTDPSVFRPTLGEWWYLRSSNGTNGAARFGNSNDRIVPADYTGDGKTDIAIFRPSTGEWFVLRSENGSFYSFPFGTDADIPAPADYDGDNRADAAVFRPSNATWYINRSSGGTIIQQFGSSGDVPAAGDYDGDGRADIAVFRPSNGQWWIQRSTSGTVAYQFGATGDRPVPADYTGDGKFDAAIFRPSNGNWYVLRSENLSFFSVPFGTGSDIPAPGDYDGDGRTDFAVFRPFETNWYVNQSGGGNLIRQFGLPGDRPVPSAFVP